MKPIIFVAMEPTSYVAYFTLMDQILRLLKRKGLSVAGKCNVEIIYIPERLLSPNRLNFSFDVIDINVTFTRVFPSLLRLLLTFLVSFFVSLYLYFKLIVTDKDFRALSFNGIFIGDSLLSVALRRSSSPSFKLGFRFFLYILRAINIIQLTKSLEINQKADFYLLFDWHYYERILYKCLAGGKVKLIDSLCYDRRESIKEIHPLVDCAPFVVKKRKFSLNNLRRKEVDKFFKLRFDNPSSFQWYLSGNGNLNSEYILDEDGQTLFLPDNGYVACIFLHSFVDGYVDTVWDGFIDQLEYLKFLIEKILVCGFYDEILIKPHPQTFSSIYPTDEKGIEYLKRIFGNKIKFLNKRASLVALSKGNIICFSHHGSVVEECHYLGMPCVGFKHGPWREYSEFLYIWESKSDLERLIDLGPKKLPYLDSDIFYKYVYEYRLCHKVSIKNTFLENAANTFSIPYNKTFEFGHEIAKFVEIYGLFESLRKVAIEYKKNLSD